MGGLFQRFRLPFALYVAGLSAQLGIDLYFAAQDDSAVVAGWAQAKILLYVLGPLLLLGLEQGIVRNPGKAARILKIGVLQSILLAVPTAAFLVGAGKMGGPGAFLLIFGAALSSLGFAFLRSRGFPALAQLSAQCWKLTMAVGILLAGYLGLTADTLGAVVPMGMALGMLVTMLSVAIAMRAAPVAMGSDSDETVMAAARASGYFVASSLILGLSLYADQVLLNWLGMTEESAIMFRHASVIVPPIVAVNGFLAFVLMDLCRRQPQRFQAWLARHRALIVIVIAVAGIASLVFGWALTNQLDAFAFHFDWRVGAVVAAVGVIRTLFLFPSTYIAAWGRVADLRRFVLINASALAVAVAVFFLLLFHVKGEPLLAVCASLLTNWSLRLVNVYWAYAKLIGHGQATVEAR